MTRNWKLEEVVDEDMVGVVEKRVKPEDNRAYTAWPCFDPFRHLTLVPRTLSPLIWCSFPSFSVYEYESLTFLIFSFLGFSGYLQRLHLLSPFEATLPARILPSVPAAS